MSRSHAPPYLDPLPALSRAERNAMMEEAYDAYSQLFAAIRIARAGSDPHATALGGVSEKTTNTIMMCTTTTVTGTLEELAELYTARDSHYVLDFAESKRLYELESPSTECPLRCVGLRYSRWATFTGLVSDRDILYLEVMDEFVDKKTGRRGWARCTKSYAHAACPPSQHPKGPLRAELFVMGHVVRETATIGVLELITLVHADVKNNAPTWIARIFLKARKKNADALNHVLKVKRRVREGGSHGNSSRGGGSDDGDFTGRNHALSDDEGDESHRDARACKGCTDHVSRWSRSYKCRKCHELICKKCATMKYLDTDTKELRNRICAECSFAMADDDDTGSEQDPSSQRGRFRSDASKRGKHKERKHQHSHKHGDNSTTNGSARGRIFSFLSNDDATTFTSEAVESPSAGDENEMRSTMHQLEALNATKPDISSEQPTDIRRERKPSAREDPGSVSEPPALNCQHSRSRKTMDVVSGPPGLLRQNSGNCRTSSHPRTPQRPLDAKQPSREDASNEATPVVVRPKAFSMPVPRAEPPAMVDLSYLQSFAAPKTAAT